MDLMLSSAMVAMFLSDRKEMILFVKFHSRLFECVIAVSDEIILTRQVHERWTLNDGNSPH